MPDRKTKFNPKWKETYSWIDSVSSDIHRAYCKLCKSGFSVAAKGHTKITEHIASDDHQRAERAAASSHSLHRFFSGKISFFFL